MAERVQSGPQQSRARRCSGAAQRTLDGEDRSERITGGRKGSLIPAYSPTKIPEFPEILARRWDHQPGATSEALLAITPEIANSRPVALTRWLAPLVYSRTTVV